MSFIKSNNILETSNLKIGGKATQLAWLERNGFNVPAWVAVPSDVELDESINQQLKEVFLNNNQFSVRSSGIQEDGATNSFAGQFKTLLNVDSNGLFNAIKEVRASGESKTVKAYSEVKGVKENHEVGVVVQEMLSPEVSGVIFSKHPSTGEDVQIINSAFGLGEGIVSGEVSADQFEVSGKAIKSVIADKHIQFKNDVNGGVIKVFNNGKSKQNSLSEKQVLALSSIAKSIEEKAGKPQDIEFCIEKGEVFILQTRPITSIKERGEYTVYDNSNIIESYPGITSELTFSFIIKMYEAVYKQLVGLFGVSEKNIQKNSIVFEHTLAHVRGRVFYNLLSWYKMLAMLPGYSINARFMEGMMGVKEKFELKEDFRMSKSMAWWRIGVMIFKVIRLNMKLKKDSEKFNRHVNKVISEYKAIAFEKLTAKEIIEYYHAYEKNLLDEWKPPMVNDFFAMIFFGVLQKQCVKLTGDEKTNLHNELLCGSSDIISTEPIHRTLKIVKEIQGDKEALNLFETRKATEVLSELKTINSKIYDLIQDYIDVFGDRCVGELKLENRSFVDYPEDFVKVLQSYISQSFEESAFTQGQDKKIREEAEAQVLNLHKEKGWKKWLFNWILRKTRYLVSNRENLRFQRTKAFGIVRKMMNAMGVVLHKEHYLNHPKDIFHLKLEEILKYNTYSKEELLKLVEKRKAQYKGYELNEEPSSRFFTYGEDFSDEFIYSMEKVSAPKMKMEGIGCSPGKVRGKVKVVHTPQDLNSLNGDILVTRSTDPGWVPLFPTCSAILVERGSLLSHSAIVSREMGIPCVVGVDDLLVSLKTGDEVIMNGETGEILVVNG